MLFLRFETKLIACILVPFRRPWVFSGSTYWYCLRMGEGSLCLHVGFYLFYVLTPYLKKKTSPNVSLHNQLISQCCLYRLSFVVYNPQKQQLLLGAFQITSVTVQSYSLESANLHILLWAWEFSLKGQFLNRIC